jgi:hypothetical protein
MQTTVLDLCDRDEQDDTLFPIDSEHTIFSRKIKPVLNHVIAINEHTQRGPGEFGQRFVFDINKQHGDFILNLYLQIKLGHWFTEAVTDNHSWFYANSLGTAIIARAELEIDGIIIETIDSDYINIKTLLSFTSNQFGAFIDGMGHIPIKELLTWPSTQRYPTENGTIICPLLFHFNKHSMLPILSIKEKSIRVNITLRPFKECIRRANQPRLNCNDTPLGTFLEIENTTHLASSTEPQFKDLRLLVQSVFIDNPLRQAYITYPFEYLFRESQTFRFTEPTKYITTKSTGDSIRIQLPLEINGPIEELWWIFRRKSAIINNEWTNYSSLSEYQMTHISNDSFAEPPAPIKEATIQINGVNVASAEGNYFREHIAKKHNGGFLAYKSFIYGYSFASVPNQHQPSGSFNASRAQTIRLLLDIQAPPSLKFTTSTEWSEETLKGWEILIYSISLNWMRIENGMANKLFSS